MATNKAYPKLRDYVPQQSLFKSPTEPTGRVEDGRDVVDEIYTVSGNEGWTNAMSGQGTI
jgi:hypothetical protein